MPELRPLIEAYLSDAKLMQLATVAEGRPWVCSVWYAHDEDLSLYFLSGRRRRHSLELSANPAVAGAVVVTHSVGSGEIVRGLQYEGTASEAPDQSHAKALYMAKYPTAKDISLQDLADPASKATFYVVRPSSFVLFDEVNFPHEPRRELVLRG